MSAIKIGKYYLTKNNPRELLRLLAEEEDKIDEYKQEKQEWINLLVMFKNQQKEFISYLENMLDNENDIFSVVRVKDVLSKYEETIGGNING